MVDIFRNKGLVAEVMVTLAILAVFFALCWQQIELPGLHPDEAQEVVPLVQIMRGLPYETLRDHGLWIGGQRFPLMIQDYIGAVNTYLYAPFALLLGVNVASLRLMSVLTSIVTLLLVQQLGRAWGGRWVGLLATLLLAMQPSFIFWSRQGVYVTFVTVPLTLGALLCGWHWWRSGGRPGSLYLGMFLLGLGISAKLLAGWAVFGVGGAFALLYGLPRLRDVLRARSLAPLGIAIGWRQVLIAGACLAAGLFMLIVYNLQTGGTFAILRDFGGTSYYGVDNRSLIENFAGRVDNLRVTLTGEQFWYLTSGPQYHNPLWWWILPLLGVLTGLASAWRARERWRAFAFAPLAVTLMLASSVFTVSALWATHMAIVMPFPALGVALWLGLLWCAMAGRLAWLRLSLVVVVVLLIAHDLAVVRAYHADLSRLGGFLGHSAAVYRLMDALDAEPDAPLYAVDWGIQNQVRFLSAGLRQPIDIAGTDFAPDPGFADRVRASLATEDALYIFHAPGDTVFQRRAAFLEVLKAAGRDIQEPQLIYDVTGRPVFEIVRLKP
ncbi:MAG: glycosyltransferase family 39 protein [Anaerolineae bacterium]|nr:glycosyltransferase family 39 protein [Anaerolineae bacterium]MDW8172069.1 glycosyltransferase family 39 protein [Anaerolineae bacterium]